MRKKEGDNDDDKKNRFTKKIKVKIKLFQSSVNKYVFNYTYKKTQL